MLTKHLAHLFLLSFSFSLANAAGAASLIFNSSNEADVDIERNNWLAAIGVTNPQYIVDFESGFTDGENISGVTGLAPGGLVITDTSSSGNALISSDVSGTAPLGSFAVTQNELPYLELDFSFSPVEYVAFRDIDHNGTSGVVTFVGEGTQNITLDTSQGVWREFYGIFRNDMPLITKIQLDASGDGLWGIDNIEYGVVPIPPSVWLFGSGLMGLVGIARRKAV